MQYECRFLHVLLPVNHVRECAYRQGLRMAAVNINPRNVRCTSVCKLNEREVHARKQSRMDTSQSDVRGRGRY